MTATRAALLELATRVEKASGPDDCWPWPRKTDERGRGRVWLDGKLMLSHRAIWTVLRGPIPAGKILCHHCDNPNCINPRHLYVGTHADNMRDMTERKRHFAAINPIGAADVGRRSGLSNDWARGEHNPKAKLSADDVVRIREDRRPTRYLAAIYGVDRSTIQRVRRGALWSAAEAPQ